MNTSIYNVTDMEISETDTRTFSTINITITSATGEKLELVCFPNHSDGEKRHHISLKTSVTSNSGE